MYITSADVLRASKLFRPLDRDLMAFPEGATTLQKILHKWKLHFLEHAFSTCNPNLEIEVSEFKRWVREAHYYVSEEISEIEEVAKEIIRQLWQDGFDLKCYTKSIVLKKDFFIFFRKKMKVDVLFVSIIPVEDELTEDWENRVFPPELL